MRTINYTDENGEMHKRDVQSHNGKTYMPCQVCGKQVVDPVYRLIRGPKTDISWPNPDYVKPHYERVVRNIKGKPYWVMKWVVPTPGVEPKEYSTVNPITCLAYCRECYNPVITFPDISELKSLTTATRLDIVNSMVYNSKQKYGPRLTIKIVGRFGDDYILKACRKYDIKVEKVRCEVTP